MADREQDVQEQEKGMPGQEEKSADSWGEEFDSLLLKYKDVKAFKIENAHKIMHNFVSEKTSKFNFYETPKDDKPLNLSSTAVCSLALSEYREIWKEDKRIRYVDYTQSSDKKKNEMKGERKNDVYTFFKLEDYYNYILNTIDNALKSKEVPPGYQFEEFVVLNVLSMLKTIQDAVEKENPAFVDGSRDIVLPIIKELSKNDLEKYKKIKERMHVHPFLYYRFLIAVNIYIKDNIDRNAISTEIFKLGKKDLYRQISYYKANDQTHFDVKRLIYSLMIVMYEKRYSNNLVIDEALDIIFKEQYKTGLWPTGRIVKPNFIFRLKTEKKAKKKASMIVLDSDTTIIANPLLSSVECLNDMLAHEELRKRLCKYNDKIFTTYSWIKKSLIFNVAQKRPLGWYPEYESSDEPQSWVAAHCMIFIKRYCDFLSWLISRRASKDLHLIKNKDLAVKTNWEDIKNSYNYKKYLRVLISEKASRNKQNPSNKNIAGKKNIYTSALIYGPPGSGKTTAVRTLAKMQDYDYIEISPGEFLSEGITNIIPKINNIFERLYKIKNTIIFFDEVDQLVELRESGTESTRWIVTSLLPKLQELHDNGVKNDIKFFLATNSIDKVDPAIKRRGRMDFVIPVGAICWKDRLKMLQRSFKENFAYSGHNLDNLFIEDIHTGWSLFSLLNIDNLDKEDILNPYVQMYLIKTDYMTRVDIDDKLKEIFSGNKLNESKFEELFVSDKFGDMRYNVDFEHFHNNKYIKYIDLPMEYEQDSQDIDLIMHKNIFGDQLVRRSDIDEYVKCIGDVNKNKDKFGLKDEDVRILNYCGAMLTNNMVNNNTNPMVYKYRIVDTLNSWMLRNDPMDRASVSFVSSGAFTNIEEVFSKYPGVLGKSGKLTIKRLILEDKVPDSIKKRQWLMNRVSVI